MTARVTDQAVRRALEWLDADDAEVLNVAECLGMEGVESSDEDYRRAWVLLSMVADDLAWRPGRPDRWWRVQTWIMSKAGHVEWSERWTSWPHCNGQNGCWMHVDHDGTGYKCWCSCRWCRVARFVRRDGDRV